MVSDCKGFAYHIYYLGITALEGIYTCYAVCEHCVRLLIPVQVLSEMREDYLLLAVGLIVACHYAHLQKACYCYVLIHHASHKKTQLH
jgi:hypothetical protein